MWRFLNEPWDADVKGVWLRAVPMAYDTYALSHYTPISKFESFDCTSASYDEIDLEVSLDAKHRGCCGISLRCVDEDEDNEDEDNNGNDHYACLRQRASTTDSPRTEERRGETGSQQQQQRCSSSSSSSSNSTNTDTDQNEIGVDDACINCSSRFDLEIANGFADSPISLGI
ncbi:hypothetical protein HZH66_003003 [Vespula vulgaris]|uniref:Uncharacterized protein n=1 Tax=Vespula vulgaris TaxID=7454 RepID=A0A834KQR8_VESVU|nr:hypothetical protein HZH66_003003 [Vespula vulgaris]